VLVPLCVSQGGLSLASLLSLRSGRSVKEPQHWLSPWILLQNTILSTKKKLLYNKSRSSSVKGCCVAYLRVTDINISCTPFWIWTHGAGAIRAIVGSQTWRGLGENTQNAPAASGLLLTHRAYVLQCPGAPLEGTAHVRLIRTDNSSVVLDVLQKYVIWGEVRLCNLVCRGQSNTTECCSSGSCFANTSSYDFFSWNNEGLHSAELGFLRLFSNGVIISGVARSAAAPLDFCVTSSKHTETM